LLLHRVMASLRGPRAQVNPPRVLHRSEYWALIGGGVPPPRTGTSGPVRVPVGSWKPRPAGPTPGAPEAERLPRSRPRGVWVWGLVDPQGGGAKGRAGVAGVGGGWGFKTKKDKQRHSARPLCAHGSGLGPVFKREGHTRRRRGGTARARSAGHPRCAAHPLPLPLPSAWFRCRVA
jgi:hypothetical protein